MNQRNIGALPGIGEKVDLYLGHGPTYRTQLEDIDGLGLLLISQPLYRGIPIVLRLGQQVEMYYFRPNGRFCIDVEMEGVVTTDQVRLIALRRISEPRKQQRRESFRLMTLLEAVLRPVSAGPFPARRTNEDDLVERTVTTENISETGVSVWSVKIAYDMGEKLYIRLYLPWPDEEAEPLELRCEVRRCELEDPVTLTYGVGLMFMDCPEETRQLIARYVLVKQQEQLRMT